MCSDDFADAANEVSVGSEFAAREERLKLGDYFVEALYELGDAVNRIRHVVATSRPVQWLAWRRG